MQPYRNDPIYYVLRRELRRSERGFSFSSSVTTLSRNVTTTTTVWHEFWPLRGASSNSFSLWTSSRRSFSSSLSCQQCDSIERRTTARPNSATCSCSGWCCAWSGSCSARSWNGCPDLKTSDCESSAAAPSPFESSTGPPRLSLWGRGRREFSSAFRGRGHRPEPPKLCPCSSEASWRATTAARWSMLLTALAIFLANSDPFLTFFEAWRRKWKSAMICDGDFRFRLNYSPNFRFVVSAGTWRRPCCSC